jgi:transcription antitermination protein NusB
MSKAEGRSAARLAASQALYQMEVADSGLADILAEFESHWIGQEVEGEQYNPAEIAFFRDIVSGVLKDQHAIDRTIDEALAAAFYELKSRPDVPARAVITEYVDVAAAFFGKEECGMINAVLDGLARKARAGEFEPRG